MDTLTTSAKATRELAALVLSIDPASILSIDVETIDFDSTAIFGIGSVTSTLVGDVTFLQEGEVTTVAVSQPAFVTFSALLGNIAKREVTDTHLSF